MSKRKIRLAVIASHAIQYHAPLFRAITSGQRIDLKVFFCSRTGLDEYWDRGFSTFVTWNVPLTEGYAHEFLPDWSPAHDPALTYGLFNPSVIAKVRRKEFDAVLIFGWGHLTEWMALLAAIIQGVPILLRSDTNVDARLPKGLALVRRLAFRLLFGHISGFLAVGRRNAQFYLSRGVPAERIFRVPFAIDNDFLISRGESYRTSKESLREELGLDPSPTVFLSVGKLIPRKRPQDLLFAFERIMERSDSALVFVGEGELRPVLERYVVEKGIKRVTFVGFCTEGLLSKYYSAADVFVLPSGFEPWGLVLNEAMCFGLPVIASKESGASADLVGDGVNGFIYPAGDVAVLAERMALLSDDTGLRQRMGNHSLSLIRGWGLKETIEGLEGCLEAVCGEDARTGVHTD